MRLGAGLRRREFLGGAIGLLAIPGVAEASISRRVISSRAVDLVAESNVIDMLGLLTLNWGKLDRWQQSPEAFGEADFQRLKSSGIDVFHPAVALENGPSYPATRRCFEHWNRFIGWHPKYFMRVDRPEHMAKAKREGKIGLILGMQDASHFRSVVDVGEFYALGQRLSQLTYNFKNSLGDGCKVPFDRGLTGFGVEVVARMNALGMALDVSHCGQRTSLDAIAASTKPVLITHSNCRALAPGVERCKPDEVIVAAARKGGVMGITSVRQFVRANGVATLEDVLNHFDHAVRLVGVEHVGVGSDFDLDAHPMYDIAGLNQANRVYRLTEGLLRRGYARADVALMLGGNFQRALGEIWG